MSHVIPITRTGGLPLLQAWSVCSWVHRVFVQDLEKEGAAAVSMGWRSTGDIGHFWVCAAKIHLWWKQQITPTWTMICNSVCVHSSENVCDETGCQVQGLALDYKMETFSSPYSVCVCVFTTYPHPWIWKSVGEKSMMSLIKYCHSLPLKVITVDKGEEKYLFRRPFKWKGKWTTECKNILI